MASPLPLFAIQDLESLRQLPGPLIYIVLICWDVKSKRKLFLPPAEPGYWTPAPVCKSNGMLKILMENGQWKKGGEPRTSTHRFV